MLGFASLQILAPELEKLLPDCSLRFVPTMASPANFDAYAGLAAGAASQMSDKVVSSLNRWIDLENVRRYFLVNHSYVIKKLALILCSFLPIVNAETPYGDTISSQNRIGMNQPDLYIPLLSFVTYILTIGLSLGTDDKFEPDALGSVGMTGFLVLCFEVVVIRIGLFVLKMPSMPVLDCVAYSGYKYVGIALSTIVGIVFGRAAYYLCLMYCAISMAKFIGTVLYKHVKSVSSESDSSVVKMCLFAIMLMQLFMALFLGQAPRAEAVVPPVRVATMATTTTVTK
jgi:hypothetical protein